METKGGFYISQIKQISDRIFQKMLTDNEIEISGGQGRILFSLWKKNHQTIGEIGEACSLAKNTVSIIVDGMVSKGILTREINPSNRRQTIISLSDYTFSIKEKYDLVTKEMNELFYKGFTEEEQKQFEVYLERILNTLKRFENDGK